MERKAASSMNRCQSPARLVTDYKQRWATTQVNVNQVGVLRPVVYAGDSAALGLWWSSPKLPFIADTSRMV